MVAHITKRHGRYKHDAEEHGYLVCRVHTELGGHTGAGDPTRQTVCVNLVGSFGLSCASCW